ncbi:phage portal protein [Liquorilactobacillus nagelii]|uniref:phage portal protein n=1 Tax=Liquorilactobacillus nagelii TaxID=82688 RepID=UPI0039E9D0A4
MSVISKIKDFFRKGGAAIGMTNSLNRITDDPRIATDQDEVDRIRLAKYYYAGSYEAQKGMPYNTISYFNSQNAKRTRTFNSINVTQMVAKRIASICLNSGFTVSIDSKSQDDAQSEFNIGDTVILSADHMPGMQGAIAKIDSIDTGAYEVDYWPTDGSAEVTNHKWVVDSEMAPTNQAFPMVSPGKIDSSMSGMGSMSSGSSSKSDNKSDPLSDLSDFINDWLERSGVNRNLESKLEQGIPTGGFAARPYVDNGQIKVAWVRAEQFYSLDSNTEDISQAVIASKSVKVVNKQRYYYTLLEFHQWNNDGSYQITNELYKSTDSKIVGEQVALGTDNMYSDIEQQAIFDNGIVKHPLFIYFKCPGQNNLAPESPLGVGFVNNCQNILDAINYTHDSFVWEVRMGKRKVLVPPEVVKPGDEYHQTGQFDPDQDVYQPVAGLNTDGTDPIVQINPEIRVQDYDQTMQHFLHELENGIGLSSGTFSTDSNAGITTATQVVSENSMTYQTRASYLNRVTKFLSELIYSVVQLAQTPELFDGGKAPLSGIDVDDLQISVHYDDGVFVDKDAQAKQDLLSVQGGTMPKKQYIMRNYGKSETEADEWLAEIKAETPTTPTNESPLERDLLNGGDE